MSAPRIDDERLAGICRMAADKDHAILLDDLAADLRDERALTAELLAVLENIASGSPPDDWEYFDSAYGEYSGYGEYGSPDFVDAPDESNSDDVHSHGWACGRWAAAKLARSAIAKARGRS